MQGLRLLSLICLLITIYLTGTLIFTKGFLLMRTTLKENSSCIVDFAVQADDHGEGGCWMHMRYKKAIILLIDALKYDFLQYNTSLRNNTPPFKNKFLTVHQLINRYPNNARLYKFMADPPTTTLQRLKGLTTGSLPTFIDIASNFGSSEIAEDNIIDQLVKHDKKITFIGDDVWMDLFPRQFSKAFPIPSFNVKDLHVCDNTVIKHLMPQLRKQTWDVLIVHLLGVDHCGHRFGPNHPAMAQKLTQMDDLIRNITRYMKDDTILFVLGDHGMTNTGDHGGDSLDELEAGLFVYSTLQITSSALGPDKTVAQTDFVPTLSLLMGVPIPFSNLGMIISDLFNHCPWWKTSTSEIKQVYHTIKALRLNAYQMSQYLESYSKVSSDFPLDKFKDQEELLKNSENELQHLLTSVVAEGEKMGLLEKLKILQRNYEKYIGDVREACQDVWARFDVNSIVIGIITLVVGLVCNVYFFISKNTGEEKLPVRTIIVIVSSIVYLLYTIIQTITEFLHPLVLIQFGAVFVLVLCVFVKLSLSSKQEPESQSKIPFSLLDICSSFICMVYFWSYFSNSYVVYEDRVLLFLGQTMIWLHCLKAIRTNLSKVSHRQTHSDDSHRQKKSRANFDILQVVTHPIAVCLMTTVMCSLCLTLMGNFRVCREEQVNCTNTLFLEPLANLSIDEKHLRNVRYFFSVFCLALFTYCTQKWMKHYGNLNSTSFAVMCFKYGYPFSAVCCVLYWALQGIPQSILDSMPAWQHMLLPQLVYGTLLIAVVSLISGPLCVMQLATSNSSAAFYGTSLTQLIPQVYNQMKIELQRDSSEEDKPPTIYGLGSVYTASIIHLITAVGIFLALLLGDRFSPSLLLALLACFFFLELYAAGLPKRLSDDDSTLEISWSALVTHGLMMSLLFSATGQQATVTSIRWESAFTGFHGDVINNYTAGFLIICNTFAAHIFFTVTCALYLFWPYLEGTLCAVMTQKRKRSAAWRGDFTAYYDGVSLKTNLFKLALAVLLFSSVKLLGSVAAAGVHRRHLMVWKIFAPRFIFEAISNIVIYIFLLLLYLFVLHIDNALSKFVKTVMT